MTTLLNTQRTALEILPDERDYCPFPSIPLRNALQEAVEVPLLVRLLRLPLRQRILEVGCGRGIALVPLARLCQPTHLVGLDIDRAALDEAEQRLFLHRVPAECFQADVRDIPFPDDSFDLVIDFGTCYHIAHSEQALSEIARVLRPRGLFVHETLFNQHIMHPIRSMGNRLPWRAVPCLTPHRTAFLWSSRMKQSVYRPDREVSDDNDLLSPRAQRQAVRRAPVCVPS